MERNEQHWAGWLQLLFGLAITILFFYMMAPFMVAILLGAVLSIICYPIFQRLTKKIPRALAALVTNLAVSLGIFLPLMFVLYSGVYRLLNLLSQIKIPKEGQGIESFFHQPWFENTLRTVSRVLPIDRDWVHDQGIQLLQQILEVSSKVVAVALTSTPKLLVGYFVVTLSFYFFLVDGSRFLRFLSNLSPLPHARSLELYGAFEKSCRGVVIGLFASSLVQGFLMTLFFLLCGLPNAPLMGIVTIVMGMVPVVGSAPIWIGATVYLFLNHEIAYGILMLCGGIIIATSDNVVRPWVMKGHSEIHPLLALVSVFGAVNLLGPTGIFLGPVIAAVFVSFLKILALEIRRETFNAQSGGDVPVPQV